MRLIRDAQRDPFPGLGKPEPLKHELSGCWSRRINQEHPLVYQLQQHTRSRFSPAVITIDRRFPISIEHRFDAVPG